jgi:hypothetical protein
MSIKSILRNYRLKSKKGNRGKNSSYNGYNKAKTIGICFHSKDVLSVTQYADSLIKSGKSVQLLQYVPLKKKEIEKQQLSFDTAWFCKGDANWLDIPQNDQVSRFLSQNHDIYIDLMDGINPLAEYVSICINSLFKIGMSSERDSIFDLVIKQRENEDLKSVFKEIEYYLNFINQDS